MPSASEQLTGLSNTMNVLDRLFGGSKGTKQTTTTSGSTITRGKDITEEGMQNIINKYLAGPGGIKDISGAARGAGLYNSSTESLLRNDLATRVAGEAAERGAKEVTTTSPMTQTTVAQQTGGLSPGKSLAGIAGAKLIGSLLEDSDTDIFGSLAKGVGNLLGGSATSSAPSLVGSIATGSPLGLSTAGSGLGLSLGSQGGSILSSLGQGLGSSESLGAFSSGINMPGFQAATDTLKDLGSLGASDLSSNFLSDLGLGNVSDIGGISAINPIANLASGFFGDNPAFNPMGLASSMLGGALAMGPPGVLVAPVLSLLGHGLGSLSVICTALTKRGLLDTIEYAKGEEYIKSLSPYTITGYYLWGTKVAKAIDRGNPWAISLTLPWAYSRMKLLSSHSKWKYFKYPLGTITQFIGQPLCWVLGVAVKLTGEGYGKFV